jgi:hypothetical protein
MSHLIDKFGMQTEYIKVRGIEPMMEVFIPVTITSTKSNFRRAQFVNSSSRFLTQEKQKANNIMVQNKLALKKCNSVSNTRGQENGFSPILVRSKISALGLLTGSRLNSPPGKGRPVFFNQEVLFDDDQTFGTDESL